MHTCVRRPVGLLYALLGFAFQGQSTIVYRLVSGLACASPGPARINGAGPFGADRAHLSNQRVARMDSEFFLPNFKMSGQFVGRALKCVCPQ